MLGGRQTVRAQEVRAAMAAQQQQQQPDMEAGAVVLQTQLLGRAKALRERNQRDQEEVRYLESGGSVLEGAESVALSASGAVKSEVSVSHVSEHEQEAEASLQRLRAEAAVRAARDAPTALRVDALRLQGLWSADVAAAPSGPPPGRANKTHWDLLLDEAVWLAREVAGERKWKENTARRVALAARKGLTEMRTATGGRVGGALDARNTRGAEDERDARDQAQARKVARQTAHMIRGWWKTIDQLVTEKAQAELDSIRREAVSRHLNEVVDQTANFAKMLATQMTTADAAAQPKDNRAVDDDVFQEQDDAVAKEMENDVGTLLEAEAMEQEGEVAKEVEALQQEADMDIQQLLKHYEGYKPGGTGSDEEDNVDEEEEEEEAEGNDRVAQSSLVKHEANGDDLLGNGKRTARPLGTASPSAAASAPKKVKLDEQADYVEEDARDMEEDLGTLLEAEQMEKEGEVAKEVDALQKEADMDINDLLAQYGDYRKRRLEDEDDESEGGEDDDEGEDEEDEVEASSPAVAAVVASPKVAASPKPVSTPVESVASNKAPEPRRSALKKTPATSAAAGDAASGGAGADAKPSVVKKVRIQEDLYEEEDVAEMEADVGTLLEAEAMEKEGEVEQEIEALKDEANMSIEDLLKMYGGYKRGREEEEEDDDDGGGEDDGGEAGDEDAADVVIKEEKLAEEEEEEDVGSGVQSMSVSEDERASARSSEMSSGSDDEDENALADDGQPALYGTEQLLLWQQEGGDATADGRSIMEGAAREAQQAQPTGTTLATSLVRTKLPSLLRGPALREYQHIGLDWLVTMYNKGLNGILADEMGLGKTVMTISLLGHLAEERHVWGPHLIVVPTSVLLNWEKEFKFWFPSFKILTYYGSVKQRHAKRVGWSRPNAFHVCITSYNIVLQDASVFRRKRWQYLILDEAHNIRNFRSKKWQTLLSLKTRRRLLLTGTPLQNNLMELWSLLHFLMPHIFQSHSEFKEWFSSPLDAMIEGKQGVDQQLLDRLHTVLRPFLLRRLKKDVEHQLPDKHEHVVLCRLSKRQRGLYEEFLASRHVKDTLSGGNVLGVMNVLMQLRKVCNHPDLFEERPIVSPLDLAPIDLAFSRIFGNVVQPTVLPRGHESLLDCELNGLPRGGAVGLVKVARLLAEQPGHKQEHLHGSEFVLGLWSRIQLQRRQEMEHRKRRMEELSAFRVAMERPLLGADVREAFKLPSLYRSLDWLVARGALQPGAGEEVVDEREKEMYGTSAIVRAALRESPLVTFVIPKARTLGQHKIGLVEEEECGSFDHLEPAIAQKFDEGEFDKDAAVRAVTVRQQLYFPDKRLIQYDCGKLQELAGLLERLKAGGHRVLIFTQMTRMLDILETFLTFNNHKYLRLDGATRTDKRYQMMERFNEDKRIFCFILSTRSGGLGINLTGADTVVFFDSDWNPAMDAQAQDRCHRIGQTREVHVYRLISSHTVEENILRKALQKRQLERVALQDGGFNVSALVQAGGSAPVDLRELIGDGAGAGMVASSSVKLAVDMRTFAEAAAQAEDEQDRAAAEQAAREAAQEGDEGDFGEEKPDAAAAAEGEDEWDARIGEQLSKVQRLAYRMCRRWRTAAVEEQPATAAANGGVSPAPLVVVDSQLQSEEVYTPTAPRPTKRVKQETIKIE